jgi:L-fucose isomerase-like protein
MINIPEVKLGIVAVSRDCFPIQLSERRRAAIAAECTRRGLDIYEATTAVVVQYPEPALVDAHQIYRQLDEVKYQYGCFLASYLRDGVPTVPAPAPIGSACP